MMLDYCETGGRGKEKSGNAPVGHMLSAFNQLRNDAAQGQQTLVDVARLGGRP
jgi:hypothetical protein